MWVVVMFVLCFFGVLEKLKLDILISASCSRADEPQASGGDGPFVCVCVCGEGVWVGG
jgi:hypothetical protein